ncbi:pyridoxal phosphate-dependent aminotransferase, partial [bacterium]|nr:pyridoxal phosphate-dependent aminotransferase [bacterium]
MSFHSISQRGRATPASPIRKLAPYAETAKANGIRVFHLNIGQPDIHTPIEFYKAVNQFSEKVLSYNPSNGIPQFIECLVDYYQKNGYNHIQKKDIVVNTGGSEAIIFSFMAVASPGEEILTFEPFYPNYNGFAHMAGIDLIPVETDPKGGYRLPQIEAIREKITSKTKAILICSPNNPTGTVLTYNEMEIIEKIALKHNLFVLSDEVYREFIFDEQHTSILSFPSLEKHAILMDSLSKRYSACGARIGCIVSKNSEVMETVLKFGQARLCPPTLEQIGACALVKTGDKYFQVMLHEFKKRRDTLFRELLKIPGVNCIMPQGAFYLMVSFPVDDIEDFARWLLTDFNVNGETTMIAPGPGFYATPGKGKTEARIAYVL